ncbi:NAD(P)/FAD-dependent oxidoreductase [bacterium]|nr:NAD(P)/FAD-dependent oxidoreductase [bacterium]
MTRKIALIIGAGPAGLTAASELIARSDITPVIFEETDKTGGLSRTETYKGNRLDIGGHRFFSKSKWVNAWWLNMLPLQNNTDHDPDQVDNVMLVRDRRSHIYFLNSLFEYPVKLNIDTFRKLGLWRTVKICVSYLAVRIAKEDPVETLEDLFIHRFGKELYRTFFKGYTEKVWGVSCREIKPEWGSQRIKNLSIAKTLLHAIKEHFLSLASLSRKAGEPSLIKTFTYPKFGPGQLWEEAAARIRQGGGSIIYSHKVTGVRPLPGNRFLVRVRDEKTGNTEDIPADYLISSMPLQDLIAAIETPVPEPVMNAAAGLVYRHFIIVGLLLNELALDLQDQWIYIQEDSVRVGRLQLFNNWSPYMVRDSSTAWIGAEYFCSETDEMWRMTDRQLCDLAAEELVSLHIIHKADILDAVVIRQPKAYPAYFGTYDELPLIRAYLDQFIRLFPIGRNGMHRYNNQDHSMLSALTAVELILQGTESKEALWNINTEEELHEGKR